MDFIKQLLNCLIIITQLDPIYILKVKFMKINKKNFIFELFIKKNLFTFLKKKKN